MTSNWLRRLIALSSLSSLLVLGLSTSLAPAASVKKVSIKDLEGKQVAIDFASSPLTLVNFWAVWCMPCRDEIPDIAKLVSEFGGKGLKVYGIALESGEAAEVKSFLADHKEFGVNYPILLGADDTGDAFGGVMQVPTTFLVDARGKILKRFIGVTSDFHKKMSAEITRSLQDKQDKSDTPPPKAAPGR
jgi:thiol-disulfide isomerase/thioredoxin